MFGFVDFNSRVKSIMDLSCHPSYMSEANVPEVLFEHNIVGGRGSGGAQEEEESIVKSPDMGEGGFMRVKHGEVPRTTSSASNTISPGEK